jgi:hypothetical protein
MGSEQKKSLHPCSHAWLYKVGKAFMSELAAISDVLEWAHVQDVKLLESFVADAAGLRLWPLALEDP